jgi:hypothetical protein
VDNRQLRTIVRQLVAGLAPPEQGGLLNLPEALKSNAAAAPKIKDLLELLTAYRQRSGLPPLDAFFVSSAGVQTPVRPKDLEVLPPPKRRAPKASNGDEHAPG